MRPAPAWALAALLGLACGPWAACRAGSTASASTRFCDAPAALTAEQKDKLFRFGAVIKAELDASGHSLALVARSGLDRGPADAG